MKIFISVFILVLLLAAASGCTTQQTNPTAPVAAVTTPVSATEVPTVANVSLPKTMPVTVTTTGAPGDVTATATAIPRPSNTWSVRYLTIHIRNNTYVPDQLTILPGAGVTWINDDSVIHIVKATGDSAGKFTSAEMVSGAQFHYTFGEKTGTFEFGDPGFPEMKGTIIVRSGESVVGASSVITQGSS